MGFFDKVSTARELLEATDLGYGTAWYVKDKKSGQEQEMFEFLKSKE